MSRSRGFTLIELMIVVAIFAVFSAVLVPNFLRARSLARETAQRQEAEEPAVEAPPEPTGAKPVYESARVELRLQSERRRCGLEVVSLYVAELRGELLVEAHPAPVSLVFPFPADCEEAFNASLVFVEGEDEHEPAGVEYRADGIVWTGSVSRPTKIRVSFTAPGRDRFQWPLPPNQRIRSLNASLDLSGVDSPTLPSDSLAPSWQEPGQLRWELSNLVTDRPLAVDFPGAQSPVGRASQLFQLTGLAILLFGAGFWYLSELHRPGQLDRFRLVDFLLLATTYSLFFVIFSVLEFREALPVSLGLLLSAAISLPLLALHTSRIADWSFAITRAVPMAAFTAGVVVNGVYGGAARDYGHLAAGVFLVVFVTLTYRSFRGRREEHRLRREAVMTQKCEQLLDRLPALTGLHREAAAVVESARLEGPAKQRMETLTEELSAALEDMDRLGRSLDRLKVADCGWERKEQHDLAQSALQRLSGQLPFLDSRLREMLTGVSPSPVPEERPHCVACGGSHADSPFCPRCGVRTAKKLGCDRCGHTVLLPRHLLAAMPERLHCPGCGRSHTVLTDGQKGPVGKQVSP